MQPPQAIKIVFVQVTDGSPISETSSQWSVPSLCLTPNWHKIWSLIPTSLLSPLLGHLRNHSLLVSPLSHKLFLFCLLSWFFFIILSFKYCIVSGSGSHISSLLYSSSSPLTPLVIPSRLGALNSTYTEMVLKRTPPPPTLSWLPTASDQQTPS